MLGATEVVDGGGLEPLLSLLSSTSLGLFVVCFRGRIRGFFCKDCLVDGMRSMQGGIGVVCCLSLLWICLVDVVSSDETVTYTVRSGSNSGVGKTESVVEAQNVRVKLATAEERVKALASKLDAVSEDASRARLEIHSTLLEAWNIVDTLGRDRCGDAVLEVRRKQQEAEAKLTQLETEIVEKAKTAGENAGVVDKLRTELDSAQYTYNSERNRRVQIETELNDVKDRLKHALALTDRADIYGTVQTNLKQLNLKISDRTEFLRQILQFLKADIDAEEGLENTLTDVKTFVYDHESEYSSAISSLTLDPAKVSNLEKEQAKAEKQLREVLEAREEALRTVETLQKHLEAAKRSTVGTVSNSSGRGSVLTTLFLMLISIIFGGLLVIMGPRSSVFSSPARDRTAEATEPSFGRFSNPNTPGSAGATPHPNRSGGNRSSPGERPPFSTGADYFSTDRTPMTYMRASASPPYRNY